MTKIDNHKQFVLNVIDILHSNNIDVTPCKNPRIDFTIKGHNCRVCAHNLTGSIRKNMVIEYCTDKKSDVDITDYIIFIIPNDPKKIYMIPTESLYKQLNWGVENDRRNFKITRTCDILLNSGLCVSVNLNSFKNFKDLVVYNKKENIDVDEIRERNKMVIQYERLVHKIVKQFTSKIPTKYDDVLSMAWEGLVMAFNSYDPQKSTMNFTQYAAFAIRNNILSSLDDELRTVKMSAYAQKKAAERGETGFNSIRIDVTVNDNDDERKPQEIKLGMYENEKFSDGDVYDYLYLRLDEEFSERDCQMFYMNFGLKQYDMIKGKDIAKMFGVSEGLVSQRIKRMCKFIRKDEELCEMLGSLNQ